LLTFGGFMIFAEAAQFYGLLFSAVKVMF
jgi:hypothetical protein